MQFLCTFSLQPSSYPLCVNASVPSHVATSAVDTLSKPVTRYQTRVAHARAEQDRMNSLNKMLQSSEEARIQHILQSHIEKMQNQVENSDVHSPFKSYHDIITRLLPFHILSEPDADTKSMDKADAMFESVAQVLLTKSLGLSTKFQQMLMRDARETYDSHLLTALFLKQEEERKQQEVIEKKQAEQIAADLSVIGAEGEMNFDGDFSLLNSDPMLGFSSGIT